MELLRRTIETGERTLRLQLAGARARLETLRGNVAQAEDNFLLTKSRFAAGASLALEVLSAQQSLTDARLALLQAQADIRTTTAKIRRLEAQ